MAGSSLLALQVGRAFVTLLFDEDVTTEFA